MNPRSPIYTIAHDYVEESAAMDPILATRFGIPGHDHEMSDYSPDGFARVAEHDRKTAGLLDAAPVEGEPDRIARDFMRERFAVRLAQHDAGESYLSLRTLGSPMASIRSVFDQMPQNSEEAWANIAARMNKVPGALDLYRRTLDEGIARGAVVASRQVEECARQAAVWSGEGDAPSFFSGLRTAFGRSGISSEALGADVDAGAQAADEAYAAFRRYLVDGYLPNATDRDASGPDRYALSSRFFNGAEIDVQETYAWAWDDLHRIEREMQQTAERIKPGAGPDEARALLDSDPARQIDGVDAYRAWLQELHDDALRMLDGKHFDIDPRVMTVEVMIPPPGGPLAPYYSGPSEDFTRPGRTWWPIRHEGNRFPKWTEVTIAYHEGVPGHHLQVGSARCLDLSRFQQMSFISGYGEGWALYAERLMGELGFLDVPDYYMGMLSMQAMRAVRVIVDIGMHLELPIPKGENFHPGETWNADLAIEFAVGRTGLTREFMTSEVLRYLGWPAQAISYKVGERVWLDIRDQARKREGASFDLKQFHTRALALGPMGLDQLRTELVG